MKLAASLYLYGLQKNIKIVHPFGVMKKFLLIFMTKISFLFYW